MTAAVRDALAATTRRQTAILMMTGITPGHGINRAPVFCSDGYAAGDVVSVTGSVEASVASVANFSGKKARS